MAPLSKLVFKIFSAVATLFQNAAEYTIKQPRFKRFLSSSKESF